MASLAEMMEQINREAAEHPESSASRLALETVTAIFHYGDDVTGFRNWYDAREAAADKAKRDAVDELRRSRMADAMREQDAEDLARTDRGGHAIGCRCRLGPDGARIASMDCLAPAAQRIVLALLAARAHVQEAQG